MCNGIGKVVLYIIIVLVSNGLNCEMMKHMIIWLEVWYCLNVNWLYNSMLYVLRCIEIEMWWNDELIMWKNSNVNNSVINNYEWIRQVYVWKICIRKMFKWMKWFEYEK